MGNVTHMFSPITAERTKRIWKDTGSGCQQARAIVCLSSSCMPFSLSITMFAASLQSAVPVNVLPCWSLLAFPGVADLRGCFPWLQHSHRPLAWVDASCIVSETVMLKSVLCSSGQGNVQEQMPIGSCIRSEERRLTLITEKRQNTLPYWLQLKS